MPPSDSPPAELDPRLHEKLVGLGEHSSEKNYPELMRRVVELERFRALLEQSNDGVFLLSLPTGRVIDANELACRHLDVPTAKVHELTYRDFLRHGSAAQLETLIRMGIEKATFAATLGVGSEVPVEVNMKVVLLGSEAYAVLVARDITERLRAAAEMKRLTTAVEQAGDAVAVTEPEGRIVYVNPAFDRFTGHPDGYWIGRNLREVLASGRPETEGFPDIKKLGNAFTGWCGNVEYLRGIGQTNQAEVSFTPVRDDAGTITSMVVIARDITLEVRAEKQVRQNQRMEALGALAGGIVHEFNSILIPIIACSELIRPHLLRDSRAQEYLDNVLAAAERARERIRQIRAFSHNDAPQLRAVSVRRIIIEVAQLLQTSAPPSVSIHHEFQTEKDTVLADPSQLFHVVLSLSTNAVQAMEARGRGTLTMSVAEIEVEQGRTWGSFDAAPGTYLQLDVHDTGPGIPPELIDKIFDPLFTTRADSGATGLGLSLVYDIVKKHGGWVLVSSEPGQGALFSVFLRWAAEDERMPLPSEGGRPETR